MDQVSRRILAANVKAMVGKSNARSVRQWAMDNGMDVRQMNRIAGEKHAATVDTLDLLAERIGCQPWQLLVPNMDPDNLPMLVMGKAERELYDRVRALLAQAGKPE